MRLVAHVLSYAHMLVLALALPPVAAAGGSQPRTLADVLDQAARAIANFERRFSAVVLEEHLEQRAMNPGLPDAIRVTRADLLLLRQNGRDEWVPFRDVYEVDGRPVRDRSERLQKLFLDSPDTVLENARRISDESSRYNIGSVIRTINLPTFGPMLLKPSYARRFDFARRGEEIVSGIPAWRISFVERTRPTVVRNLRGADMRLEGTFWIEPTSGQALKALVKTVGTPDPGRWASPRGSDTLMRVEVTFAWDANLDAWAPDTMTEWGMVANGATVSAKATYSNSRRFEVTASETFR